jgi:hypothetical protein
MACVGKRRGAYRVLVENLREIHHLDDPRVDRRVISRWILRKWEMGVWTESSWLMIGTGCGHLRMR